MSDAVSKLSVSYDEMGRAVEQVREVWNPSESPIEAQKRDVYRRAVMLDAQGKPTGATLPGAFGVEYGYNERSLVKSVRAGFGGVLAPVVPLLAYDAQGALVRSDYGNATTNCRWYDARHRVTGRKAAPTASQGCVSPGLDSTAFQQLSYAYTAHGLLESVVDETPPRPDGVRFDATYQYDRLYELAAATTAEGTVSYRYDVIQNLISQRATQADTGLPLGDFAYGEGGAGPNAVTRAGREAYRYDGAGRMQGYHGFALEWDAQDKLVSATRGDGTRFENYYGFDGERVVEVVRRPGKAPEVHRYVFGDYVLHGEEPTWVVSAGAVKVAEVTETAGLVPTLAQLDELVALSLDGKRRPLPAARELLDFDGNGTQGDAADVEAATWRYVEGAVSGVGVRLAAPVRVWRYYHEDQLGAPTHVSDSGGEWVSAGRFQPYGRPYGGRGERVEYGFAGSQREAVEELGLTRMGARWYAADIGRWVSPDPLYQVEPRKALGSPLAAGLYGYALGNPIALSDLGGLDPPLSEAEASSQLDAVLAQADARGLHPSALFVPPLAASLSGTVQNERQAISDTFAGLGDVRTRFGVSELERGNYASGVLNRAIGGLETGLAAMTAPVKDPVELLAGAAGLARALLSRLPGVRDPSGMCFTGATLVVTEAGAVPISDLRVGDRVLTYGDRRSSFTTVEPETWRLVRLRMSSPDRSGVIELELLRPLRWLRAHEVEAGASIDFVLEEMGLRGPAVVVGVEACPRIKRGLGRVVLATVRSLSGQVLELRFEGSTTSLEPTAAHRLFSADRHEWVPASLLAIGERIVTVGGGERLSSVRKKTGIHRVYNIEVETEHSYLVSVLEVLSHNAEPCAESPSAPKWSSNDPLVGDLANEIESRYPGHVVGVNVPLFKPNGDYLTDIDIQLKNANVQVKSGSGKGMTNQLKVTNEATGQFSVGFAPEAGIHLMRNANKTDGIGVTNNRETFLRVVAPDPGKE